MWLKTCSDEPGRHDGNGVCEGPCGAAVGVRCAGIKDSTSRRPMRASKTTLSTEGGYLPLETNEEVVVRSELVTLLHKQQAASLSMINLYPMFSVRKEWTFRYYLVAWSLEFSMFLLYIPEGYLDWLYKESPQKQVGEQPLPKGDKCDFNTTFKPKKVTTSEVDRMDVGKKLSTWCEIELQASQAMVALLKQTPVQYAGWKITANQLLEPWWQFAFHHIHHTDTISHSILPQQSFMGRPWQMHTLVVIPKCNLLLFHPMDYYLPDYGQPPPAPLQYPSSCNIQRCIYLCIYITCSSHLPWSTSQIFLFHLLPSSPPPQAAAVANGAAYIGDGDADSSCLPQSPLPHVHP